MGRKGKGACNWNKKIITVWGLCQMFDIFFRPHKNPAIRPRSPYLTYEETGSEKHLFIWKKKEKMKLNQGGKRKHIDPQTLGLPLIWNELPKSIKVETGFSKEQATGGLPPSLLNAWAIENWDEVRQWPSQELRPGHAAGKFKASPNLCHPSGSYQHGPCCFFQSANPTGTEMS